MKERDYPLGGRAPESVFLVLDPDSVPARRAQLLSWLEATLPKLNWRSHVFVVPNLRSSTSRSGQPVSIGFAEELAGIASRFLSEHEFATLYLHPLITVRSEDPKQQLAWDRLLAPAKPFQTRAYREQAEARLFIAPLLTLAPGVSVRVALEAAQYFRSRFAMPSFHVSGETPAGLTDEAPNWGIRSYVDAGPGGIVRQLWVSHVFETVLDRIGEHDGDLLAPCLSHLVADEEKGRVFSCFRRWERGGPGVSWSAPEAELPEAALEEPCAECIGGSLPSVRASLVASDRRREARQVCFELALALAVRGTYGSAAELARHAFELSERDEDRAAALIQEGLCRLKSGEFEKAERALELATGYALDQGVVAFYRGKVQFAWRDYIEALDRFEEALRSGSEQVPVEDVRFQMALCHINIEEYAEARRHLAQCRESDEQGVTVFYLGICDLREGRPESAMAHFTEALRLGPAEEDLSRVLFNIGFCLKELGRLEEAIDVLERAIKADPEDLANYNLLGFCYYKLKRHERAVECFRRAVEIEPSSAIDWANLGSNLRDLRRIDEARAAYQKALSLDPTIEFARVNLAKLREVPDGDDR